MFFSVIIATYNRADLLDRCLESLVNQTYKDFEVIVCDDGSTDKTSEIILKYQELLNLQYSYAANWGGPAVPRNRGIKLAKGQYICFLDSDDWFKNNKLEYIANCSFENYDVIYHDLDIYAGNRKKRRMTSRQLQKNAYNDLLFNLNTIATSSAVVKKDILLKAGGFKEDRSLIAVEDFDMWIRMASLGARFKYISEVLGYYYVGDDNITSVGEKQIQRFYSLYNPYISQARRVDKRKIKAALAYQIARIHLLNREFKEAVKYFKQAFLRGSPLIKFKALCQFAYSITIS